MTRRIAIFTGSRADWGLLSMPAKRLVEQPGYDVVVIATGQHAGPSGTFASIARDGIAHSMLIDMQIAGDGGVEIAAAMGRLQIAFADALAEQGADMLVILGDRYEALTAATVATMLGVPIVHIAGGDVTEGAIDDAIRHAISKLAHLHFVTNTDARRRLLAMGEAPERVLVSGSPGIDRLLHEPLVERGEFFARLSLSPRQRNVIATFHPVTLSPDSLGQLQAMLDALATFGDDLGIIFTGVNADPGFSAVDAAIAAFAADRTNVVRHGSLGSSLYTNALRHCDAVIGNSSSGLYEAPSMKKPAVNIGDRQQGRLRAASVIDCNPTAADITAAMARAFVMDCSAVVSPYGDGTAAEFIARSIAAIPDPRVLLRKRFTETTSP